jgi:two-component system LytT family response regulator
MKTVILDDEPYCVELLMHLLQKHCPGIEILAHFTEPRLALEYLKSNPSPDLVFLDVEMPRLNAFDLLSLLHPFTFKLIFTTAYDKYAVKAIKFSALDYLLKPIDIGELKSAVQKAEAQHSILPQQLEMLLKHQGAGAPPPERIAFSTQAGIDFVTVGEIVYCCSDGSYSEVFMKSGQKIVLSKPLKDLEEILPKDNFFRIHHSYLLNLQHVIRYIRGAGGEAVMVNGEQLPVARNRKNDFLGKLGLVG